MVGSRLWTGLRVAILLAVIGVAADLTAPGTAQARVGGGRSFGRSSGFGGRPQSAPRYASPSHESASPGQPPASPAAAPNSGGGFMRGIAGGMAGGFLGSMLFNSLGHANGFGGGEGGGVGLFEILLFAGLGYLGFRWWKSRQQAVLQSDPTSGVPQYGNTVFSPSSRTPDQGEPLRALVPMGIDPEAAADIFFKVQGAWTRRDLTPVRPLLGQEVQNILESDLAGHRANHTINRLENIAVRRTDVLQTWQEDGCEYCTVRFLANLLDYTVNETTGQVLEGNAADPVKFEEDWTFSKRVGTSSWALCGIAQV